MSPSPKSILLAAGLAGFSVFACRPPVSGTFSPAGYEHTDYHYRVKADGEGKLLPTAWKLDNYYSSKKSGLEPKDASGYVTTYNLDTDGDGKYESSEKEFVYDLRYEHLEHDGVIFLRTFPISGDLEKKKLDVLMDRYIEQIAGAGYEVVSPEASTELLVEKRYAAAVVERTTGKLAGLDAAVVTLDIANLDQIKVDPNARKQRVQLVLLHTNFSYETKRGRFSSKFPVLMLAGYANQPKDFSEGLVDFQGLLSRIEIGGASGFSVVEAVASTDGSSSAPASDLPSSTDIPPEDSGSEKSE